MSIKPGQWIAGADGCKDKWCVVLKHLGTDEFRLRIAAHFEDLMTLPEMPTIVAVDIPIGLPHFATTGGRKCEAEARQVLGKRRSSVFNAVGRLPLTAATRIEAQRLSHLKGGQGVSAQAWGLSAKLREVDLAMTVERQRTIHEVHPEVSFWAMNASAAMAYSKKSSYGEAERISCLLLAGFPESIIRNMPRLIRAGRDDVIDACAAAWTAERIMIGKACRMPREQVHDDKGLDQAIWY